MMPKSVVRLSAGRQYMTDEKQAFCFLAGASSIFTGDTLRDAELLQRLGIVSGISEAHESAQPVTISGPPSSRPKPSRPARSPTQSNVEERGRHH